MADTKTGPPSTPLSDDPVIPTNGRLSAKSKTASHPAGAEPALDTLFHRTALRFCPAAAELRHSRSSDGWKTMSTRIRSWGWSTSSSSPGRC